MGLETPLLLAPANPQFRCNALPPEQPPQHQRIFQTARFEKKTPFRRGVHLHNSGRNRIRIPAVAIPANTRQRRGHSLPYAEPNHAQSSARQHQPGKTLNDDSPLKGSKP
jgi:hypothetical protein